MLYTLGHSDHTLEAFLALLQRHRITAIADVRSAPYSRRHPQFNREPLQAALREAGVAYVFLGRACGARSDDPAALLDDPAALLDGQVDYERLARTPRFRDGVTRIAQGALTYRLALLCAERDPMTCHRTILVSRSLVEQGLPVEHILYDGTLEPHTATLHRLRADLGLEHPDLFHTDAELETLAYRQQGERLAYRPDERRDAESNP